MLVTELPIWEDHPYGHLVPSWIEVRRGLVLGEDTVAFVRFHNPIKHVSVGMDELKTDECLRAALNILGGMRP